MSAFVPAETSSSAVDARVFLAAESDRAAWDGFVATQAQAESAHRWEFHEALRRVFGLDVYRFVAARAGRFAGVLPVVLQKSVVGRFLTSVPYLNHAGVLSADLECRAALARAAAALAAELRADRLELRGRDGANLPIDTWPGKAQYVLALPRTPAELWESLGAKLRSQVRRPGKEGFEARVVAPAGGEGRNLFYPLLARRWHELGSPVLPERFFAALEAAFPTELEYVVVERRGAAAAGILLRCRDEVEIPWAASSGEHDRAGVNMLLYWKALERAIETGAARFDFGRSTPGSGNARFKTQWGALERPLHWNVAVKGGAGRSAERESRSRGLVAAAWRMLPGFVAAKLGPVLAARIPY